MAGWVVPKKLLTGSQRIQEVGRRLPLSESKLVAVQVDIHAIPGNTSVIYVGSIAVRATAGTESGWPLKSDSNRGDVLTLEDVDLAEVWIDGRTVNDGVTFAGWQ